MGPLSLSSFWSGLSTGPRAVLPKAWIQILTPIPRSEPRTSARSWPDPNLHLIAAINGPSAISLYNATAGVSALGGEVRVLPAAVEAHLVMAVDWV